MSPVELIDVLEKTGTGAGKLDIARDHLEKNKGIDADVLLEAMKGRWPEGTIDKARRLLKGVPVAEFLGTPPPHSAEVKEERAAKAMAREFANILGKHQERQQEAQEMGVGRPSKKPAGMVS